MKGVGEPCAGEPHARFDGRGLEPERDSVTAPVPDPTMLGGWLGTRSTLRSTTQQGVNGFDFDAHNRGSGPRNPGMISITMTWKPISANSNRADFALAA